MARFEWQNEDHWEEIPRQTPQQRSFPWRRLALWAAVLVVVGLSSAAALQRRLSETSERISADVLSSLDLLYTATANADREVFISLLSGRSDTWAATQLELFRLEQVDRRLGITFERDANQETPQVTLTPNLRGAEVRYTLAGVDAAGDRFPLERVEVLRQGQTRWLLAPPEEEFWGGWTEFVEQDRYFHVRFPERDASDVWLISSYLEEKVKGICRLDDFDCPDDFELELVFHPDPYTLVSWSDPEYSLLTEDLIVVPSPTLVGHPVDAAGRIALQRQFAALVLPRVLVALSGYACCPSDAPFVQGVIDVALIRLGVLADSRDDSFYRNYLDAPFSPVPAALGSPLLPSDGRSWRGQLAAEFWLETLPLGEAGLLKAIAVGESLPALAAAYGVTDPQAAMTRFVLEQISGEVGDDFVSGGSFRERRSRIVPIDLESGPVVALGRGIHDVVAGDGDRWVAVDIPGCRGYTLPARTSRAGRVAGHLH